MLVASRNALDPVLQKYALVSVHTHSLCSSKDFDDSNSNGDFEFLWMKFSDPFGPLIL